MESDIANTDFAPTPHKFVGYSHIRLTYITHFYCNIDNIDSVISLLRDYEKYNKDILDVVLFIVIDDGSPVSYEIPQFDLNLHWIRINEDIPWNQSGARNLGAVYAKSDNIVFVDLDHKVLENTMHYMAYHKPCGRNIYKIKYEGRNKGHSNLFFLSRARFMRFFGYDEEFAGHYGAEDFRFIKVQKAHGSKQLYLPNKYRVVKRVLESGSDHSLDRDLTHCTPIDLRKKLELRTYGLDYGYSKLFLNNFTWKFLSEQKRTCVPMPKSKKWWYYLWYFRWIFGYK